MDRQFPVRNFRKFRYTLQNCPLFGKFREWKFLDVLIAWDPRVIKSISVCIHWKSVIARDIYKTFPPDTGSLQNNFKFLQQKKKGSFC